MMKIQCSDKKTFELIDGLERLGYVSYERLFSFEAEAVVGNNLYKITPKGVFSTIISITKNQKEVANMQMNWKGNIIISLPNGKEYILKAAENKFVFEDQDNQKLMLLDPDFNWAKFSYNYTISYEEKPQEILLILLTAYAANYYITAMSSAMY